jgi:hypothetical protein
VAVHLEYLANRIGVEKVGIGSDFDDNFFHVSADRLVELSFLSKSLTNLSQRNLFISEKEEWFRAREITLLITQIPKVQQEGIFSLNGRRHCQLIFRQCDSLICFGLIRLAYSIVKGADPMSLPTTAWASLKKTSVLSITPPKDQAPGPKADSGMSVAVCAALSPGTWPVTRKLAARLRANGVAG